MKIQKIIKNTKIKKHFCFFSGFQLEFHSKKEYEILFLTASRTRWPKGDAKFCGGRRFCGAGRQAHRFGHFHRRRMRLACWWHWFWTTKVDFFPTKTLASFQHLSLQVMEFIYFQSLSFSSFENYCTFVRVDGPDWKNSDVVHELYL